MKKILFILLALAIPGLLLAEEPLREWTSPSGETIIKASLDESKLSDPENVYLLKDGKRYKIPFENLSPADQNYVTKARNGGRRLNGNFGLEEVPKEDARGIEVVPAGKRYALLIGVNKYAKPIKSLQYCVKDMELLADSFQKSGMPKENIFLVTDDSPAERLPTGANIRRQIENITGIMEPSDQLIVAFSGHGVMVEGKSYLCPSDTDVKNKNTIVSRDWVFEQLEKCKAKQKIFIIDACRNEVSFGSAKALGQVRSLDDPIGADTHGFVLIASCDKNQQSWEHQNLHHGVFTYFLAEGLAGAVKDEDGYVSVLNLFQYASAKTKKYVLREFNVVQVPTFRQGGEMTDFCLAKLESPKPTPIQTNPAPAPVPVQTLTLDTPGEKAGDRRTVIVNGVEFAFRWCPPGTFTMGASTSESWPDSDETQHQVTLTKGFWMMETEVTVGMFKAFVNDMGYDSQGDTPYGYVNGKWKQDSQFSWRNPGYSLDNNHPVTNVSWNDAVEFCKWLSRKTGQNITLPTEAQWEYACRADSTTAYFWGNALNGDKANCNGNYPYGTTTKDRHIKKTMPVGSYASNNWGLYDMHGNVVEWCQDWKADYPSGNVIDPTGPSSGSNRVLRGGGWDDRAQYCRSANRSDNAPDYRCSDLGFRVSSTIANLED